MSAIATGMQNSNNNSIISRCKSFEKRSIGRRLCRHDVVEIWLAALWQMAAVSFMKQMLKLCLNILYSKFTYFTTWIFSVATFHSDKINFASNNSIFIRFVIWKKKNNNYIPITFRRVLHHRQVIIIVGLSICTQNPIVLRLTVSLPTMCAWSARCCLASLDIGQFLLRGAQLKQNMSRPAPCSCVSWRFSHGIRHKRQRWDGEGS